MNIIEQLMVEHAALRLHFHFAREKDFDAIYELEEFVRTCHARIEDELVFPKLKAWIPQSLKDTLGKDLSRLEADHKLIEKIGDQIRARTVEGDAETLTKRILLYMNTVESHNAGEESLIFPYWKASETEECEAKSGAWKVIQSFGLNRYFAITGFSGKLAETIR